MKRLISLIYILLISSLNFAQLSQGGFPLPETLGGNQLKSAFSERVEMPPFDISLLTKSESQNRWGGEQFAYGFKTELSPENSGRITHLPDGTKVWRLHIRSYGASSINLIFSKYKLTDHAQLFIYSPDRNEIIGAFTSRNNHPSGILATTPIEGDEVVVELSEPSDSNSELTIGQVSHGYRSLRSLPSFEVSKRCNINVECDDVSETSKRSTLLMITDGVIICSGSLINNTEKDGTPYFLTAAHCISNRLDNRATSISQASEYSATSVFYFNYQSPHCLENVQGSMEMSLSGADVVAFSPSTDLALLKLHENLPREYNAYLSGWNRDRDIKAPVYTLHHPWGDVKKYSISQDDPIEGTFNCCDDQRFKENAHWLVTSWEKGVTEPGSSGGPLFDSNNLIIGALSGGDNYTECNTKNIAEAYYRINQVWSTRNKSNSLAPWLDPNSTGAQSLSGMEPHKDPSVRLSNYNANDELYSSTDENYVAGHNSLNITEYAEYFEQGGTIYGVYFIPEHGRYSENDTIWIKIYSGKNQPEKEIYRQRAKISDVHYKYNNFQIETASNLSYKDNYLHFDKPVYMDSSFYVVFELPKKPIRKFALFTTDHKNSGINTAFFKDGNEWKPFSEHPLIEKPSSLLVDVQMSSENTTSSSDVMNIQSHAQIFPNPTHQLITIDLPMMAQRITICNLQGMDLLSSTPTTLQQELNLSSLPAGIYLIKIIYSTHTEVAKIVKQ